MRNTLNHNMHEGLSLGLGDIHGNTLCVGDWIKYKNDKEELTGQLVWDALAASVMVCYENRESHFYYQVGHEAIEKIL